METVDEVLQTVGRTIGVKDLTLGDVLRVLIMVLVGWLVIRLLMGMVDRLLNKSKSVGAIKTYIHTAVNIFLWFLLALMLAETLGIKRAWRCPWLCRIHCPIWPEGWCFW